MIRPRKIISGGQTGADQGALFAAKALGIPTGGHMPCKFLTEDGLRPDLAAFFGMRETEQREYPPRTRLNVKNSDFTVWLGRTDSRGYQCTARMCRLEKKRLWVNITPAFLRSLGGGFIVNFAGNSASKDPGIFQSTYDFVMEAYGERIVSIST